MRVMLLSLAAICLGCAPARDPYFRHRESAAASAPARPIEQVHQGMGYGAVRDLLGEPTDKSSLCL